MNLTETMTDKYVIIIPARMNSTRLPNKMMLDLAGMPIIERTWRQAKLSEKAEKVIVATDNEIIFQHMKSVDAEVIMTSNKHDSGTDRLAEVVDKYSFGDNKIIINWQGDEPFLKAEILNKLHKTLVDKPNASISTLCTDIKSKEEFLDPNSVKVIIDMLGFAIYFSRSQIPFPRDIDLSLASIKPKKHLGVYAYRAGFLKKYPQLIASNLEKIEKLEQLRAIYNGYKIAVSEQESESGQESEFISGIDTEIDLLKARKYLLSF